MLDPMAWARGKKIPGKILFSKIWGSHSHDTQMPESDVDYTGVYMAPTEDVLGLNPPPETLTGEKPDYQVHELSKFFRLLVKGNPGVIEMLWTEKLCYSSMEWMGLRTYRDKFLCHTVVKQYIGYSLAQIQRFRKGKPVHATGGNPTEKWCYHMVRVAWDAERIAKGEGPKVWKEGNEKNDLMRIRRGEISPGDAVGIAEKTIERIDAAKPWPIPEKADVALLNRLLLSFRGIEVEEE